MLLDLQDPNTSQPKTMVPYVRKPASPLQWASNEKKIKPKMIPKKTGVAAMRDQEENAFGKTWAGLVTSVLRGEAGANSVKTFSAG